MPAAPAVSAVIPTHQRRDLLAAGVDALLREAGLLEVIAVVDGSTDGTFEWLRRRRQDDARVRIVEGPGRGVTAARQAGADEATGDVVLFLDDDVVAAPGLVAGHAAHHASAAGVVVVGYMPNDWRALRPERRAIGLLYRRAYEEVCALYERDAQSILLRFWAGNCSFARGDLGSVALENPGRRHEDRELGLRCLHAGLTGIFDRSLLADHRYDRDMAGYRRDSYRSGWDRRVIEALHPPGGSGPAGFGVPFSAPGEHLPRGLRRVWPALAGDGVFSPFVWGLERLYELAVRLGDVRVATLIARGIGSLEVQRGLREHAL